MNLAHIVVKIKVGNSFERTAFHFADLFLTRVAPVVSAKYIELGNVLSCWAME